MEVNPLTDHTGAEVRGIDLARPVDDEDKAALNRAFVAHSVLVIREQSLAPHQVLGAVELFGRIFLQHNTRFALPECPQIHYLSNQDRFPDGRRYIPGEGWHTDHSNDARPPKATVLHAVTLPDQGGDTQFANMAAAHAALRRGHAGSDRRSRGDPRLPEQPQRAKTDDPVGSQQGARAERRAASARAHASGEWPQVDLHQPDPHRRHPRPRPQGGIAAAATNCWSTPRPNGSSTVTAGSPATS